MTKSQAQKALKERQRVWIEDDNGSPVVGLIRNQLGGDSNDFLFVPNNKHAHVSQYTDCGNIFPIEEPEVSLFGKVVRGVKSFLNI